MKYDFLIVGAGLFGSVMARELTDSRFKVLILEKRNHIGGNCYTENVDGIHVHKYGPHYFHTNNTDVWKYVNKFTDFYTNLPRVKVSHENKLYSFPINLLTLHQIYGVKTPQEAKELLNNERVNILNPSNFEEYVISQVGWKLYHIFYEGYTTKQWGRHPSKLPASIARRIPIRYTMDDTYHSNAKYQGVPIDGYTKFFENLLSGINIELNVDFIGIKNNWRSMAKKLIYSGCIDSFFDYQFGNLEYRSLRHETKIVQGDYQGSAQINYTDINVEYTRTIEHKHIQHEGSLFNHSVVTNEYPVEYDGKNEPFYPIGDMENNVKYNQYKKLLEKEKDVIISGRLGKFKYIDMDFTINMALNQTIKNLAL